MSMVVEPKWWPYWFVRSPRVISRLIKLNKQYQKDLKKAEEANQRRYESVEHLPLPPVDYLELTVLLELKALPGFIGDCGISYMLKTNKGSLLFDLGFGKERTGIIPNAQKLGFNIDQVGGVIISHNHWDHMGGMQNVKQNRVKIPKELGDPSGKPCWLSVPSDGENLDCHFVKKPQILAAGIASIGPISRAMFFQGYCDEQTIICNIKDKGLAILTGCGHPTIERILKIVSLISDEPVYAVIGGLHLPIKSSRITRRGVRLQFIMGSGLPPWKRLTDKDITRTVATLNNVGAKKILLSAHDTCDYALNRFKNELDGDIEILKAGATYKL